MIPALGASSTTGLEAPKKCFGIQVSLCSTTQRSCLGNRAPAARSRADDQVSQIYDYAYRRRELVQSLPGSSGNVGRWLSPIPLRSLRCAVRTSKLRGQAPWFTRPDTPHCAEMRTADPVHSSRWGEWRRGFAVAPDGRPFARHRSVVARPRVRGRQHRPFVDSASLPRVRSPLEQTEWRLPAGAEVSAPIRGD
jgi:hypothetical protein